MHVAGGMSFLTNMAACQEFQIFCLHGKKTVCFFFFFNIPNKEKNIKIGN
jgi:hypothetical protein